MELMKERENEERIEGMYDKGYVGHNVDVNGGLGGVGVHGGTTPMVEAPAELARSPVEAPTNEVMIGNRL